MEKKISICPSVLACDFTKLGQEMQRAEEAGADRLHVDIMDGHFVPNLSMGPQIVAAINRSTDLFLSVHLMMYNPYEYVEKFIEAGADQITFHFEATEDIEETLNYIHRCGKRVGLAFRPETTISFLPRFVPLIDEVLIMTVNPGFGGQTFMTDMVDKVEEASIIIQKLQPMLPKDKIIDICVDGGIDDKTAPLAKRAGANVFAAGTFLFSSVDMKKEINNLRAILA